MLPFKWYGGKYSKLKYILPLLPPTKHYVEPFGGSASVLLNRQPSPIETYNDIYGEVVAFFRTLREQPDKLIAMLELTPYSREEFIASLDTTGDEPIEKARKFFTRAAQVRDGLASVSTGVYWGYAKTQSRGGVSQNVSVWLNKIPGLLEVAERLRQVQIENLPALDVIARYDSPNTLFYCDPPYVHAARGDTDNGYAHEMSNADHENLAALLNTVEGKVCISGYDSEMYSRLYSNWYKVSLSPTTSIRGHKLSTEVLWCNYPLQPEIPGLLNLS